MTSERTIPVFRRGVRFRYDDVRESWALLAPERLYLVNASTAEILKRIDGKRPISAIVDDLAIHFNAHRQRLAADVIAALEDLSRRGPVELRPGEAEPAPLENAQ